MRESKQKSKLGQNFLNDVGAQRRIVDALGSIETETVVEIGPGKAAITARLAEKAARLFAVEVDPLLAAALRVRFAGRERVTVVESDVLQISFDALAAQAGGAGRSLSVIGNLPYYITSPILLHMFAAESVIRRAVVMVQREVAERMTATPGSREYGLLSVLCQMHAQMEFLFTLPPEVFSPPPDVFSAVVRLEFAPRWEELGVAREGFTGFLRACFAQKRKTLGNNLRAAGHGAEAIAHAVGAAGITASVRAEALAPETLAAVYKALAPK